MTKTVCILGRQPSLGLAELERIYGSGAILAHGNHAAIVADSSEDVSIDRLGGTLKTAKLLATIQSANWREIFSYIATCIPDIIAAIPEGKIRLGLSSYGVNVSNKELQRAALTIKTVVRNKGHSIRVIPNHSLALNTAQVIHNNLVGPAGLELLIVCNGQSTILAHTVEVQNINAYTIRDRERPYRDPRKGMLPPKLAQIIINLAGADLGTNILDPFCGSGVILQEGYLMGYDVCGSDIDSRMVSYAQQNLDWLVNQTHRNAKHKLTANYKVARSDATKDDFMDPIRPNGFSAIASETYLGPPFSALPSAAVLSQIARNVGILHQKFLTNVARQTSPGFQLCLAIPAWKTQKGFLHLKVLENLEQLGYNRLVFKHVSTNGLIYHRPHQLVARELVVLTRI